MLGCHKACSLQDHGEQDRGLLYFPHAHPSDRIFPVVDELRSSAARRSAETRKTDRVVLACTVYFVSF